MKRTILLSLLLICTVAYAATTTTNYSLYKPAVGDTDWGALVNTNFDTIDAQMKANADASVTADYLSANGANCSAGYSPLGVDAYAAVESCFDVWTEAENTAAAYLSSVDISDDTNIGVSGTLLDLTGDTLSINEGTLTNSKYCIYTTGTGIVCNSDATPVTGTDTHVVFFDGANSPAGDAGFVYNKTTDSATLTGSLTAASIIVGGSGQSTIDEGLVVNDSGGGGAEDDLRVETDGEDNMLVVDASANLLRIGDFDTNYVQVTSAGAVTLAGTASITGDIAGNASTASALAANGSNCAAGSYPLGVDEDGAVESCTDATTEINSVINNAGGTNLTCSSQTCNVDDAFLLNNGDVGTGTFDFGGAVLEVPNGADVTDPAGAGQVAIDTTTDQLLYYGGAQRVLTYFYEKGFTLELPTTADTDVPIWNPKQAITITDVYCQVGGTTSATVVIGDGTDELEAIVCDADGQADDGSIANGTFTANELMQFDITAISDTPDWVSVSISYTITAD